MSCVVFSNNGDACKLDANGNVTTAVRVGTYFLLGYNCSTIVSNALQAGGVQMNTYQTPSALSWFLSSGALEGKNPLFDKK